MNNKEKMKSWQKKLSYITVVMIYGAIGIEIFAFNPFTFYIYCTIYLSMLIVNLIIDGILKDGKAIRLDGFVCANIIFLMTLNRFCY